MAKRSKRRPVRYEKDQAGCISGLISIFDFRYSRSTRRLLSDRRRGNGNAVGAGYNSTKMKMLANSYKKCQSNEGGEESEMATADVVKTSVKELMEEEMFGEQASKKNVNSAQVEPEQSDSDHLRKTRKRKNKTRAKSCDMHVFDSDTARNLGNENSFHQVPEQKTSNSIDLEVIMKELCLIHQKNNNSVKHDCHDDLDMQSKNQPNSLIEENLSAAIEEFMNQRFIGSGKIHRSKEFMDALQKLSLNKELFLKLMQDPNLLLVRHIQGLEDAQLEEDKNSNSLRGSNVLEEEPSKSRPEEQINSKNRGFFRRRSKSQESNPLKENDEKCQPSSRIVILKPGPALQSHDNTESKAQNERNTSPFSFTKIGKKLKHAIGKDSRDVITRRFEHQNLGNIEKGVVGEENGGWSSPNRNHFYTERFAKPSVGIKRGDKIGKSKESETSLVNETTGYPKQGVSNIYIEAKKHLSEMLSNGEEKDLMSRQLPKSLGRILSLPEYNFSPSCSPGKDGDHGFVTAQMRLSPCSNFHMVNENTWRLVQENHTVHVSPLRKESERLSCITEDNPDEKAQSPNSYPDVLDELNQDNSVEETLSSKRDEMNSEGVVKIVETAEAICQQDSEVLDVSCKTSCYLTTRDVQNCDTAEVCDEERSSQCLKLDSFEEDRIYSSSPMISPLISSVTRKIEDTENVIDRTERPSPVSVLDQSCMEDEISPTSTKPRPAETAIQPLQLNFDEHLCSANSENGQAICIRSCMEDEESAFEYVEAVLLASDLNWDEYLVRWLSLDQLLDPALFDEVELFSNRPCHDQKLLFDCTNEVLMEVCERYFGCSIVKQNVRPVPKGMNLIHEVWEGVEWNLLQQPSPHSLDQLVRKDLGKSGMWMNLRFETEHIVIELENSILEEILTEDFILLFVNDSMGGEFSALAGETREDDSTVNL